MSSWIQNEYARVCRTPSDIQAHLPMLYEHAKECSHISELGVRAICSTYAFLNGLLSAPPPTTPIIKTLVCVDLHDAPGIERVKENSQLEGIHVQFIKGDSAKVELEPTDLLFIDTWHIYGHLKRELEKHHTLVRKYIIMHDTEVDKIRGESVRNGWDIAKQSRETGYSESEISRGLQEAIDEFLIKYPQWSLKAQYDYCNGLTILQRA